MFYQYGSVRCPSCKSSMRLVTIVPVDAVVTKLTFACRYAPCASSGVFVIRKPLPELDIPIELIACEAGALSSQSISPRCRPESRRLLRSAARPHRSRLIAQLKEIPGHVGNPTVPA